MGIFDGSSRELEQDKDEITSSPADPCSRGVKIPRMGDQCPSCHQGVLDYDGMLNLACPKCGTVINTGGAFT